MIEHAGAVMAMTIRERTISKSKVPWQLKMSAKIVLSRLPVAYRHWRRLGMFAWGDMHRPDYALGVFRRHFEAAAPGRERFSMVEMGPGDSLLSALIGYAHGCRESVLIDAAAFAHAPLETYQRTAALLQERGHAVPDGIARCTSVPEVLAACGARYAVDGVRAWETIASGSIDYVFSHTVLQHVRLGEFDRMLREMRRVLKPDGVCSHLVDLQDMLGGALNNLRFSPATWESAFMAGSGFYTNRIRFEDFRQRCARAGLLCEVIDVDRWPELPTPRQAMHAAFRSLDDADLRVRGFHVILRPDAQWREAAPAG
ncbi:MAG: methyltransferase domain-containing protein [Lautropia sp.]